jgi:hypothetical protein
MEQYEARYVSFLFAYVGGRTLQMMHKSHMSSLCTAELGCGLDSAGLWYGPVAGRCEHELIYNTFNRI